MNVKYKSEQNAKAAELLIRESTKDGDFYMAAIHCAYYSCVQLIKHVLCNNCEINYDYQIEPPKKLKKSSHIFLLNTIKKNMRKKSISARNIRSIETSFYELKRLRIKADYSDEKIIIDNAENAIEKSKEIINEITEIYN